jgi:hypothetical protein
VINNIVWTDSWPNIAGVGYDWICIGACEEKVRKVYASVASRCGETSSLGLRDTVADGIKYGPHGGKKSKTKSCIVPWLSLKAKTDPR